MNWREVFEIESYPVSPERVGSADRTQVSIGDAIVTRWVYDGTAKAAVTINTEMGWYTIKVRPQYVHLENETLAQLASERAKSYVEIITKPVVEVECWECGRRAEVKLTSTKLSTLAGYDKNGKWTVDELGFWHCGC